MRRVQGLHRKALHWFWATLARFLGPPVQAAGFNDEAIVQLHRRVIWLEHIPLVVAIAASVVFSEAGGSVNDSFMPTVAQVLPVLFLAQVVELQFHARRLVDELGDDYASLVMQYMSVSARALFFTFMTGEAAALYASAKEPSTFLIVSALAVGVHQVIDLSMSFRIRGGDQLSLRRMVERQRQSRGQPPLA
jgi:hypothetical protein